MISPTTQSLLALATRNVRSAHLQTQIVPHHHRPSCLQDASSPSQHPRPPNFSNSIPRTHLTQNMSCIGRYLFCKSPVQSKTATALVVPSRTTTRPKTRAVQRMATKWSSSKTIQTDVSLSIIALTEIVTAKHLTSSMNY